MGDRIAETLDLVRESQAGNDAAMNELFGRYGPRVLKVVRMRMGERLRRRVESGDILQIVFCKAIERFEKFEMRDEASLINWLSKLAERTITDEVDRAMAQKRRVDLEVPLAPARPDGDSGPVELDYDAGFAVPLDRLIRSEEVELLEACIAELSPEHRELILLRNYVGLSFAAIAAEVGRPSEGAARMMHATAMKKLVALVGARGGGEVGGGA